MKVKNKEIVLRKNGQELFRINNTITDNGMNWYVFKNLDDDNSKLLFPEFIYDSSTQDAKQFGFEYCFLKVDTAETLTKTSTSMNYDLRSFTEDREGILNEGTQLTRYFSFTATANENGKVLQTLGFGISDTYFTDFLLAYLQIGFLGITLATDDKIEIVRVDEATSDFEVTDTSGEDYTKGLDYVLEYHFELQGITFYGNTSEVFKYYPIGDLTVTRTDIGTVKITGFDDFIYKDGTLFYPSSTLYPSSSLYPVSNKKITKMRFYYFDIWDAVYYRAIIDLNKADISNDGGTITITYSYERGL